MNDHWICIKKQKNQIIILYNEIAEWDICFNKLQNILNWANLSDFQDDFKKFIKLSNFLLFTDDKDLKFENWLFYIMNKLIINNDHYIMKTLCMIYVKNWTENNTVKHLISWLWLKVLNCFKNIRKMLNYLKFIYFDFNWLQNTKTQFQQLIMKNENNYHKFLIKFFHLVNEAQMSDIKYKYELNMKLLFSL